MSFIYNVVLASGAQQSNSVMHIYIYISTFGITSSTDTSAQTPGNSEGWEAWSAAVHGVEELDMTE